MGDHYNKEYFEWQKSLGKQSIIVNKRFTKHISVDSCVLDFGCGGGFLLDSINCKEKIGYDVNESALDNLKSLGIKACYNLSELKDDSIDTIISKSCLEHVPNPLESIIELYNKLKFGGKIIFSVPHETIGYGYKPNDINQHLYMWSPMGIGNLFCKAGYSNIKIEVYKEISLPKENVISRFLPYFVIKIIRKPYRLIRLILDEFNLFRLGTDADIIIIASK